MKKLTIAALFIGVLTMVGCAKTPQNIQSINPQLATTASQAGSGRELTISVSDVRGTEIIGFRKHNEAQITTSVDMAALIQTKLKQGFRQKGFNVDGSFGTIMQGELQQFQYTTESQPFVFTVKLTSVLTIRTSKNGSEYTKSYTQENEHKNVISPTLRKNEQLIDDNLSKLLEQVVDDESLIRFLTS